MPTEPCRICEALVSFSDTVHVMMNARGEEGVVDYYVCRNCYDERLAPLFAPDGTAGAAHERRVERSATEGEVADGEATASGNATGTPTDPDDHVTE